MFPFCVFWVFSFFFFLFFPQTSLMIHEPKWKFKKATFFRKTNKHFFFSNCVIKLKILTSRNKYSPFFISNLISRRIVHLKLDWVKHLLETLFQSIVISDNFFFILNKTFRQFSRELYAYTFWILWMWTYSDHQRCFFKYGKWLSNMFCR
jgi:hypothetical protein